MHAALEDLVGPEWVVTDPDRLEAHVRDWTGRWVGHTPAVVFPANTEEVSSVVRWCHDNEMAVVPQGGNTGMVGGGVPLGGELVLNLTRLNHVTVAPEAGLVVAGAGATLGAVQVAASAAGWTYGVDLGARDTATIGGTVATNAGGIHVLRYGDTRHQLLGIEAVTGTGEVVGDLRGLLKDNTGYSLPSLIAGSEGTLAVVTQVCLRLVPQSPDCAVALLAFESEAAVLASIGSIRRSLGDLRALEMFLGDGLNLVCDTFELSPPFATHYPGYLLVEVAGPVGVVDRLGSDLESSGIAFAEAAVAETAGRQKALWRYREAHTEAINLLGVPLKFDVTIPLDAVAGFIASVRSDLTGTAPASASWFFGHAGDGNIHVNVTGVSEDRTAAVEHLVLESAAQTGGSISAEHGIGRAKRDFLHLNRTESDLALYRRLKAAFDPIGILNPGVLI